MSAQYDLLRKVRTKAEAAKGLVATPKKLIAPDPAQTQIDLASAVFEPF